MNTLGFLAIFMDYYAYLQFKGSGDNGNEIYFSLTPSELIVISLLNRNVFALSHYYKTQLYVYGSLTMTSNAVFLIYFIGFH